MRVLRACRSSDSRRVSRAVGRHRSVLVVDLSLRLPSASTLTAGWRSSSAALTISFITSGRLRRQEVRGRRGRRLVVV